MPTTAQKIEAERRAADRLVERFLSRTLPQAEPVPTPTPEPGLVERGLQRVGEIPGIGPAAEEGLRMGGRAVRTVVSPILTGLEYYDRFILNPIQRAFLAGMEKTLGFEASQRERSLGTDINLIQAFREALPNLPRGGAFSLGLLAEIATDPLTYFTFGLQSGGRKIVRAVAPRAIEAMGTAGIPLRRQTARNVLAVLEVAADPRLAERVSPEIARAASTVRAQFGVSREGLTNLSRAVSEARSGFSNLTRVMDATATNLRRQGLSEAEIARRLATAPEVATARATAIEPMVRARQFAAPLQRMTPTPVRSALGEMEQRLATTTAERIRAGVTGPGLAIPFTDVGMRILPREAAARIAETAGRAVEATRALVPTRVASAFRESFVPLGRRLNPFREIEVSASGAGGAATSALRESAEAVLREAERLGARTPEEAASLINRAARGEGEASLLEALDRYNATRLRLERAGGFQEIAFSTGRELGQEAERLRGVGRGIEEAAKAIPEIRTAERIPSVAKAFEDVFVQAASVATRAFPDLRLTKAAFRSIETKANLAARALRESEARIAELVEKRKTLQSAIESIPKGETVEILGRRIVGDAGAEARTLLREVRNLASQAGQAGAGIASAAQEAEAALFRIANAVPSRVMSPTQARKFRFDVFRREAFRRPAIREFRRSVRASFEEGIQTSVQEFAPLLKTLERMARQTERLGELGIVPIERIQRIRDLIGNTRNKILATEGDIRRMISQARAIKARELRLARLEREVRGIDREIARHVKMSSEIAQSTAKKIVESVDFIGKVRIRVKPMAIRAAHEAGFVRGTGPFKRYAEAVEEQLVGTLRHLHIQEVSPVQFLAEIGQRATVVGRIPLQLTAPRNLAGRIRLIRTAEGAARVFQVAPPRIRTLRTITPDVGNAIFKGQLSLEDHLLNVAPHQFEQAFKDYLNIRLIAMETVGDYGHHLLLPVEGVNLASEMAKAAPDLKLLFEEDPLTIFAKDIRLASKRIVDSQVMLRSVQMFQRLPPIPAESARAISRAEWNRMLKSAGGPDQAVGLIIPSDVRQITKEFLSPEEVSRLVRQVTGLEQEVRISAGETLHIVDRPVAEELTRIARFMGDRDTMGPILASLDAFNNIWRRMVTIGIGLPTVAFNVRNLLSDMYMAAMIGVNPASPAYLKASVLAFISRFKEHEWFRPLLSQAWARDRLTGATWNGYEVLELATYHGLIGRNISVLSDISARGAEAFRTAIARRSAIDKARIVANAAPEAVSDIFASWSRMAVFIDGLEGGLGHLGAALRTKAALYDYSQLTRLERTVLRQFVPFYAWLRNNVPRTFKALASEPKTVLLPFRASQATISDYRERIPESLTRRVPIIMASTPEKLLVMTQKTFLPTADIDQFLRLFTEPSTASLELFVENFGGAPAEIFEQATNIDLWRAGVSRKLIGIERFPGELERIDLFGFRVPARFKTLMPRPLKDFERVLQSPEVSPLMILGIPVRELEKERLQHEITRTIIERKMTAATSLRVSIVRNDQAGIRDALDVLRRLDADLIAAENETRRPVAFRSPQHMIEVLANPKVSEETRRLVLEQMAVDLPQRSMIRFRQRLQRRMKEDQHEEEE